MRIVIKFPEWIVRESESKGELPDYMPLRRKYLRQVIRFSSRAKHSLCKIIDVIDALRKEKQH